MALATKCPHCNTIFRVAADQLKLRGGIVRCGTCKEVFDGSAALVDPAFLPSQMHPSVPPRRAPAATPALPSAPRAAPASPPEPGASLDFDISYDPFGILPPSAMAGAPALAVSVMPSPPLTPTFTGRSVPAGATQVVPLAAEINLVRGARPKPDYDLDLELDLEIYIDFDAVPVALDRRTLGNQSVRISQTEDSETAAPDTQSGYGPTSDQANGLEAFAEPDAEFASQTSYEDRPVHYRMPKPSAVQKLPFSFPVRDGASKSASKPAQDGPAGMPPTTELRDADQAEAQERARAAARREAEQQAAAVRAAAEHEAVRLEALRRAAEKADKLKARLEAERQAAAEREAARLEAERQAAAQQQATREQAERLSAEREAQQRQAAEAEAVRREAEQRAAAAREAAAQAAEQRATAAREAARLEAEQRASAVLEAARLEAERQAAEREAARLQAQQREADEREAARLEAEQREAAEREAARLEVEQREAEALEAARLEAEWLEAKDREAAEQRAAAQREAERLAAEQLEAARLEAQRLAAEEQALAQQEAERKAERLAAEAAQRDANEQALASQVEADKLAAERRTADELEANSTETIELKALHADPLEHDDAAAQDGEHVPVFVQQSLRRARTGKIRRALMALGCLALVLGLVAQGLTTFRNQLAAQMPELKPLLVTLCNVAGCRVELPAQIEMLSVEQGELQTLTETRFSYASVLRNQSPHAQAWPSIELTLDDANDKPVLRRVFQPRDYLPPQTDLGKGFAGRSEQILKLHFELPELKAYGYHIAVFYP